MEVLVKTGGCNDSRSNSCHHWIKFEQSFVSTDWNLKKYYLNRLVYYYLAVMFLKYLPLNWSSENYFHLVLILSPFETGASVSIVYIQRPHLTDFKALLKSHKKLKYHTYENIFSFVKTLILPWELLSSTTIFGVPM